jgi:hypothetical protein
LLNGWKPVLNIVVSSGLIFAIDVPITNVAGGLTCAATTGEFVRAKNQNAVVNRTAEAVTTRKLRKGVFIT